MMVGQIAAKKADVRRSPRRDRLVVVAVRDRAAHHQQQHLRQWMRNPPRIARVLDAAEMIQKRPKTRLLLQTRNRLTHGRTSSN